MNLVSAEKQKQLQQTLLKLKNSKFLNLETLEGLKPQDITVLALHLAPSKGPVNFRRNPFFTVEFYTYMEECRKLLENIESFIELKQHANVIFFIFDTPQGQGLQEVYHLIQYFQQLLEEVNQPLEQINAPLLKISLALDYGNSPVMNHSQLGLLRFGDVLERTSILVNNSPLQTCPHLLVTQAVYQLLSLEQQQQFAKAYYINHIACYVQDLPFKQTNLLK